MKKYAKPEAKITLLEQDNCLAASPVGGLTFDDYDFTGTWL